MAIGLVLAALAACMLIAINETGYTESAHALARIEQSNSTRATLSRLLQQMLNAETGSRGYLLTGDPRYLQPYNTAVAEIGSSLDSLRRVYPSDAPQAPVVNQLAQSVQRKLSEMELSLDMRARGNEDTWKFVLASDVGKKDMDAIREHTGQLIAAASAEVETAQDQIKGSLVTSRIGIAAVTVAGLLAFYLYLRQTTALKLADEQQQAMLQQERDLLETQVRERTASLAELATHLQQVREQERGHLARELHDELGALLTAAKLDVARLKSRLGPLPPEAGERLAHLTETLNSGIALKRRIIEDLRPSSLANLGLTASLEILTREFSERSGIDVIAHLETCELDESRQLTIYRLVQESLTNVSKYAEARRVEVSLRDQGQQVEVEIRDNGKGFDTDAARAATHGLAGMRHRVEASGGRLRVMSSPGAGTCIVATLPRQDPGAAPQAASTA